MANFTLFEFHDYWLFYVLFTVFILFVLALDLGVFHKNAHEVKFKEALGWSIFWVVLSLVFNLLFYFYADWKFENDPRVLAAGLDPDLLAKHSALEFLTGYVIEKALSVDNIFVFVVVFSFFGVPAKYQHRVLFFGILGALVFRTIFIVLGTVLLQYEWVVILFGVFLFLTGIKVAFAPEKPVDPEKNPVIRLLRKILPVTPHFEGQKLFTRKDGILYATPLFICLAFIEVSDIVFAVDSVPAIFAITKEPLIVFTSNIFAILGLRALFFLLASVITKFRYLKYGLGVVLMFVGLKMAYLNEAFGGKFPIVWSLGIIGGILAISVMMSFVLPPKETHSGK